MGNVQLVYATNIISRKRRIARQEVSFVITVDNVAGDKRVVVHFAGEDGMWRELEASFIRGAGPEKEVWLARTRHELSPGRCIPGDIEFAVGMKTAGWEDWDNNKQKNYRIAADSGVLLGPQVPMVHIAYAPEMHVQGRRPELAVAVDASLDAQKVALEWSADHWQSRQTAKCRTSAGYWDQRAGSNARNPNHYGVQICTVRPEITDATEIEYTFGCVSDTDPVADDNFGAKYQARPKPFRVLTLNLHCYQEQAQEEKFSRIAAAVDALGIDLVCLQEVCEPWNKGRGDWHKNAARIIRDRLSMRAYLHTGWAHMGFDRYREGVAILSRYKVLKKGARYVSSTRDVRDINARKAVMGRVYVPAVGFVHVVSVHLSWWEEGFWAQFQRLRQWILEQQTSDTAATLVGGDFNIPAGSEGYRRVVASGEFEDQYLQAIRNVPETSSGTGPKTVGDEEAGAEQGSGRIDHLFMLRGGRLKAVHATELFTSEDRYGPVSDHPGYVVDFLTG